MYREESAAKFYTGHSQQERKIMWDLLGDVKYKLQVWGKPEGFLNTQIRDLSIECQFIVTLLILKRNVSYTGNSLSKEHKLVDVELSGKKWLVMVVKLFNFTNPECTNFVDICNLFLPSKNETTNSQI